MRLIVSSFFAGLGATVAIVGLVLLSGQTFGQRCARLHPNGNAATMERCVFHLSHQR